MNISEIIYFIQSNSWVQFISLVGIFLVGIIILNTILKSLQSKIKNRILDKVMTLIRRPILLTLTLLGILFYVQSSGVAGDNFYIIARVFNTILYVYYLSLAVKINNMVILPIIKRKMGEKDVDKDVVVLIDKLISAFIIILGIYIILSIWKINLTPLLASAGVAGIALAMAAKDSLSNLFGGVSMYADTAFKVGDYIVVDGNRRGEVMETGFRSTRIKTRDDTLVTIPNSILSNAIILNESSPTKHSRIKIPVGVAYGTDLDKAEEIMLAQAEDIEGILLRPEKRVRVRAFGASSMDMELMVWIKDPSLRGSIKHQLIKKIYVAFNKNKISIPFPQMDVHMQK